MLSFVVLSTGTTSGNMSSALVMLSIVVNGIIEVLESDIVLEDDHKTNSTVSLLEYTYLDRQELVIKVKSLLTDHDYGIKDELLLTKQ